jgi:hypothetical protein
LRLLLSLSVALLLITLGCVQPAPVRSGTENAGVQALALTDNDPAPQLSPTRKLRKVYLTFRGSEPTRAQYEALLAADSATQTQIIDRAVDDALSSNDFYEQMMTWGHDYLRTGLFLPGLSDGDTRGWTGTQSAELGACPAGTAHAGALGIFDDDDPSFGDRASDVCNNGPLVNVEPWWSPGTSVRVVGYAGSTATTNPEGFRCGQITVNGSRLFNHYGSPGCGCGKNLVHCSIQPKLDGYGGEHVLEALNYIEGSERRSIWEEPVRLFAHVVTQDKPFSDLIVGDYTVVNRKVAHVYVRVARQTGAFPELDDTGWFRKYDETWKEVQVATLNPYLLAQRDYKFDPRVQKGMAKGIPAAGVLTTLEANATFPRERVRGARWLETFACSVFTSAPPGQVFNPFKKDPAREGSCQHCHVSIDPASIHFKRFHQELIGETILGGVARGWEDVKGNFFNGVGGRLPGAFLAGTALTPVTQAEADANPETYWLDFLPSDQKLFGATSDGTIGPLGFGKLLVSSGQFDQCAVRKIHERFVGRKIDVVGEAAYLDALVKVFIANDRKVKPLVRQLLAGSEFWSGR